MEALLIVLTIIVVPMLVLAGIAVSTAVSVFGEYPLEELTVVEYNTWYEIRKYHGRYHNTVIKSPFKWTITMTLLLLDRKYRKLQSRNNAGSTDARSFLNG